MKLFSDRWWLGCCIGALVVSMLCAQEVSSGAVLWPEDDGLPHGLPQLKRPLHPEYPSEMRVSSELGYVLVRAAFDANGRFRPVNVNGTHVPFTNAVTRALGTWQWTPPQRGGQTIAGEAWMPVVFNPRSADKAKPDATPRLVAVTPVLMQGSFTAQLDNPPVVRVRAGIDATGRIRAVTLLPGVDGRLQLVLETELAHWRFEPARRAGVAVAMELELPVLLSPSPRPKYWLYTPAEPPAGASRPATLTVKTMAIYPPALRGSGFRADVTVDFFIDVAGVVSNPRVFSSNEPACDEPALEAVRHWRFQPALRNGTPVAQNRRLRIDFLAPSAARPTPAAAGPSDVTTPARPLEQAKPLYPFAMLRSGLQGEVVVQFMVNPSGRVQEAAIVRSNNPAFDQPALDAVRQWRFQPATRNGQPVESHHQVPVIFAVNHDASASRDLLSARPPDRKTQEKLPRDFRFDTPPRFTTLLRPVYPYELQRDGVTGKATIAFQIDRRGRVVLVEVRSATRPEFGLALAAAAEASRCEPARRDGQPTQALMQREQIFDFSEDNTLFLEWNGRLLGWETERPDRIVPANKLDVPLKPIIRPAPEFPLRLVGRTEKGEAVVELLVDEEGRVRLPRVISATEPEFGYAATHAAASWAFEPPRTAGKLVVTRVRLPFIFRGPRTSGSGP
jgi:TonB family protein